MPDRTQCGKPLADDAAFCSACGAPVVPTGAETGAPSDAAPPAGARPPANIVMITALAVIAIVAVIGVILVANRHSGPGKTPTSGAQHLFTMQLSAQDSAVEDGIRTIHEGIYKWSIDNGNKFPPETEVRPDGAIGQYVANWPTNPYTGQPMASGSGPGDFTYTPPGVDGTGYSLTGHLSNGRFTLR